MTSNELSQLPNTKADPDEVELDAMTRPDETSTAHEPLIPRREGEDEDAKYEGAVQSSGNIFLWTLTLSACVSGLLFGYDTGVISSTLVSIGTDLSHRTLTNLDKGLITSSTSAFALVASPIGGICADRTGRKNIIIAADILFILGALWQAATNSVQGMILGRSIVGLAIGAASLITPLYISELAPSNLRGRLVTVSLLFITGGQVIAYLIGWIFSLAPNGWRWMVGLGAAPAILQAAALVFMPETPRYLCKAGRESEARRVLTKVYRSKTNPAPDSVVSSVVRAITHELMAESASPEQTEPKRPGFLPPTLSSLLFHPPHRRALTITCSLQGLQQLCGFNSLMYFSATIFQLLHFSSPTLTALSIASTNFIFTIVAFYLIDNVGRRTMLLYTIPVMAIALFLCAGAFTIIDRPENAAPSSTAPTEQPSTQISILPAIAILFSLLLYVSSYALALGPVPWTQSELFPLSVRSLGSSLSTAINWFSNTVVGLTFLPMMELLTPGWTFMTYAVICIVGWLVLYMIYPEVSGLGLEEIGDLLKDGWGVKESRRRVEERRRGHRVREVMADGQG